MLWDWGSEMSRCRDCGNEADPGEDMCPECLEIGLLVAANKSLRAENERLKRRLMALEDCK